MERRGRQMEKEQEGKREEERQNAMERERKQAEKRGVSFNRPLQMLVLDCHCLQPCNKLMISRDGGGG